MGKPVAKKKRHPSNGKIGDINTKHEHGPKVFDEDATLFIDMSSDMKEEGNKLFQKRDYEGALIKYEKAIKLLPKNHIDVSCLRSNLAACYMQMGPEEYHHAIHECNLALEVSPKYTKALLKRARCYEALNRLEAACRDIDLVLSLEPNNLTALEISDRVKKGMEKKGIKLDDRSMVPLPEVLVVKEKSRKKKSHKAGKADKAKKTEDKVVVEVSNCINDLNVDSVKKEEPMRAVKLVFGEDIRVAQIPTNCSLMQLRDTVGNRFPSLKAVLVKYKDKEGDLVTITTPEELRWAEESADPQGSVRLHITEVNPEHEPLFVEDKRKDTEVQETDWSLNNFSDNGSIKNCEKGMSTCVDNWIVQFARMFQNHVGFSSDSCLDLHDLGMKLYSEAMEDVVTSEEAQEIFDSAEENFQQMAALALFNWGNVHMSRARKRLFLSEDASKESVLDQVKSGYEWAKGEYVKAGKKYEEALKIKPDFYEGLLALGQQKFEQAKLSWYYAIGSEVDLDTWPSTEVLELFNSAEESMERGTEMWEEMEAQRLQNLSKPNKDKDLLEKMGLDVFFKDISTEEAAEHASNMRSQTNLLWGTMLYERSIVEFKLGFPTYEECLMESVEKFKLAGATPTDLAVMIKNHCANETAPQGLNFKIDEIVQAWNEMYDAKRWMSGVPSFRLEPLFRRRIPKLHDTLEHNDF
ncbi:HSP-interacting protein [Iris pallida]|uniref:HSP-interacting protein n=1 Tax=Iris pallida TaxID=29817 RepID=A0AAX6H8I7_IRIPA|nr:HSP-interacting protein [Iris pallida]